ncbi:MAG: M28 family peptidase [Alicyclobacillus sp.]|nr:M28 family peptidase [Alicyclobacillus sp.]
MSDPSIRGAAHTDFAPVQDLVTADDLMHHVEAIAQWVRLSGEPGEAEAFDYIESCLQAWGIPYERTTHPAFISLPGSARLIVRREGASEVPSFSCITHSMGASTPEAGVTGRVVDVAGGEAADYRASGFRPGEIALISGLASPAKAVAAVRAGAAGAIFVNGDELHEMIISPVWGSPSAETVSQLPNLPVVSIVARDGKAIQSWLTGGRVIATLHTQVETGWRQIPQLIAEVRGSRYPDEVVLLGGHVDSWHYGAMDNASANALQLEALRLFQQRREGLARTLRVGFWSGHSHGRYAGSTWYVDHHFQELVDHLVLHMYVDSIGGKGATVLSEAWAMSETRHVAAETVAAETGGPFSGGRFARGGDQSFYGVGVSCLFMCLSEQPPQSGPDGEGRYNVSALLGGNGKTGGLGPWWHAVDDTPDKLDPAFLLRDARIYLRALATYLEADALDLDFRQTVAELREHLTRWQETAGPRFSLHAALVACDRLQAAVEALYARALPVAVRNRALVGLSRRLVPLNYSTGNRFEPDPALTLPPIPALAPIADLHAAAPSSAEEQHLLVLIQRRANYVENALLEAARFAEMYGTEEAQS